MTTVLTIIGALTVSTRLMQFIVWLDTPKPHKGHGQNGGNV